MELFGRRRLTTGSVQKSNMYGMLPCITCIIFRVSLWPMSAFICSFFKSSMVQSNKKIFEFKFSLKSHLLYYERTRLYIFFNLNNFVRKFVSLEQKAFRYDSKVVNYDRRAVIKLANGGPPSIKSTTIIQLSTITSNQ